MKAKVNYRLILDIFLTIALLTLFSKNFFGMVYHEVAGLAVLIPISIHILINLKAAKGMCRNFKRVPLNVKLCLIVDILLLLTFLWIGISGVLISKTIFTGISSSSPLFKLYHMCLGGLSVILLGIHIGLHICRKRIPPKLALVMTVVILACGAYGITSSGLVRWVSMPLVMVTGTQPGGARGAPPAGFDPAMGGRPQGEPFQGELPEGGRPQGGGMQGPGGLGLMQKIQVVVQFSGIMFSCAMITYWIVRAKKKPSRPGISASSMVPTP